MFEVGKKYKFNNTTTTRMYTILHIGEQRVFARWSEPTGKVQSGETTIRNDQSYLYTEYKEPQTISRWVGVYKQDPHGPLLMTELFYDQDNAMARAYHGGKIFLRTLEVKYTEST